MRIYFKCLVHLCACANVCDVCEAHTMCCVLCAMCKIYTKGDDVSMWASLCGRVSSC